MARVRRRWWATFTLLVLLPACSAESDVVVRGGTTEQDVDGGSPPILEVHLIEGCQPGLYRGRFRGNWDPALMNDQPMSGSIDFTLEPTLSGEFLVISSSEVEGRTDGNATFSFRVSGRSSCQSGDFSAEMVDGVWTNNETERAFGGEVTGTYVPQRRLFYGDWSMADPALGILVSGEWLAVLADS